MNFMNNNYGAKTSAIVRTEGNLIVNFHVTKKNKLWGIEKFQCYYCIGSTSWESSLMSKKEGSRVKLWQ